VAPIVIKLGGPLGRGHFVETSAPSAYGDEGARQVLGRLERATTSPGSIVALMWNNYEMDVRHILPVISVRALILHRVADTLVPIECGRDLALKIAGAKLVELPGTDHIALDNETQDLIAEEIEEFITGERHVHEIDRVLATVMFTEIVGSTQRAAEIGDSRWHTLRENWFSVSPQGARRLSRT
jgi:hypothetical protein